MAYFGAGESGSRRCRPDRAGTTATPLVAPDTDKAKSLLQQAGCTTPIEVEYLGLPQYPELLKTGEVMQQQLDAVGIKMNIKQVEVGVWFDAFVKGNYQITSAYQERTIDPDNFYALVVHSGGDINTTGYSNPQADRADRPGPDRDRHPARFDLYKQLRQIVFDDSPIVFVHYETIELPDAEERRRVDGEPDVELRMQDVGFTTPA